ncbi:DUF6574 domain-containing protein [Lactobacillaceae bacterium Melli_B4]
MKKKCPNCGKEVDANAKFCTYCGYQFADQQSSSQVGGSGEQHSATPHQETPTNNNGQQEPSKFQQDFQERSKEAKQFSNNYFQWLLNTLKHPTRVPNDSHKYFGITSFIISFVLIGVFIKLALKNVTELIFRLMGSFSGVSGDASSFSQITNSDQYTSFMNTVFNHLFIFFLIELVLVTLIAFIIRKGIYHDRSSFLGFLNEFASYTNYALVMELVAVIFLALNVFNIGSMVLFGFVTMAYSLAAYYSVFKLQPTSGFDKIYAVLIGIAAQSLVTYVMVTSLIY